MSGYAILILGLLLLIAAYAFDLGPSIHRFFSVVSDIPKIDASRVRDPAVFSVLVRVIYLIIILGIVKLLVSRRKKDDEE